MAPDSPSAQSPPSGLVGYQLHMPDDGLMVRSGHLRCPRDQKGGFLCLNGHVEVLKCWSDSLVNVMTPKDHEELSELKPETYMTTPSNIVDMAVMLVGGQPTLYLSCHLACAAWLTKAETIAASMGTQLGVGKTPRTRYWQQNGLLSASNHNPCVAALGLPKQPTHTSGQLQALKAACRTLRPLKLRNKP
ncbi:hypothetical protein HaLaN_04225 [Haematococcus lacustris]|uniref:Uncharacterized protein n=1 Tax=Haematococcus lacustris TaxID=44745 RepID=A0A699YIS1_HAELA|nr:hypothetical protein HaLaN_04225 [Haematococcus lacustris]